MNWFTGGVILFLLWLAGCSTTKGKSPAVPPPTPTPITQAILYLLVYWSPPAFTVTINGTTLPGVYYPGQVFNTGVVITAGQNYVLVFQAGGDTRTVTGTWPSSFSGSTYTLVVNLP